MCRLVAERRALVNPQLDRARRALDGLVGQLAEAAPADDPDASTEAEAASSKQPPAAPSCSRCPVIRTKVLATLPAEGRNAVQRRDYEALRCLCGVAPVSHPAFGQEPGRDAASGGPRPTARRRLPLGPASPPNAIRSAGTSIRRYAPRGHGHARALRSVADRLLNVACAMLRDGACFDPRGVGITAT